MPNLKYGTAWGDYDYPDDPKSDYLSTYGRKDAETTQALSRKLSGEDKKGAFEIAMSIDFTGAVRDPYDTIVPGWRVVNGRMVKDPTVLPPTKCKNAWERLLIEDF